MDLQSALRFHARICLPLQKSYYEKNQSYTILYRDKKRKHILKNT